MHIPTTLRKIGKNAFAGCEFLGKIELRADCGSFAIATRPPDGALTVDLR